MERKMLNRYLKGKDEFKKKAGNRRTVTYSNCYGPKANDQISSLSISVST